MLPGEGAAGREGLVFSAIRGGKLGFGLAGVAGGPDGTPRDGTTRDGVAGLAATGAAGGSTGRLATEDPKEPAAGGWIGGLTGTDSFLTDKVLSGNEVEWSDD